MSSESTSTSFGSQSGFGAGGTSFPDTSSEPLAKTKDATEQLKGSTGAMVDDAAKLASTATGEAKAYVSSMASDASAAFKDAVETNKSAAADAIVNLAKSAQDAADGFEGQAPQVAKLVKSAAEGVEKISADIRDRSVGELVDTVSDFAKRQPAAFFGCGILAGVILSRIIRGGSRS